MTEPLLLCRVSWMEDYRGLEASIHTNASYVRKHGFGGEIYNFLPSKTRVYGFVQFPRSMRIEKLGASPDAESITPVTVIWTAPRKGGGVYVVGWYRNATVYRDMRRKPNDPRRRVPGS